MWRKAQQKREVVSVDVGVGVAANAQNRNLVRVAAITVERVGAEEGVEAEATTTMVRAEEKVRTRDEEKVAIKRKTTERTGGGKN